jgi:hypothetical protein
MRQGRCLCSAVRYELEGDLGVVVNCHCQFCRRAHGGPFVTISFVPTANLRFVEGAESICERHTPGVGYRAFCSHCGTSLYNRAESAARGTSLVVATLDDDRDVKPAMHINLESKASWYEIRDDLPCFEGLPPGADRALEDAAD